jgi:hypothetical protein
MAGDVRRPGGHWRAAVVRRSGGLAPPGRHTCHERHGGARVVATQRPVVTLVPRRARLTRVRHVRRRADVAARDVAAEHAPVFARKNSLLIRFSKLIFFTF